MTLEQLAAFHLIAQLGSLSKAAKVSQQAQSLLSRRLSQLEEEWGDRLFYRTGRGVTLTEFGEKVYPYVKTLLADASRLQEQVIDASGVPTGAVHIGMVPSIAMELASMLYTDVKRLAPQVHLRITDGFSGQIDSLLAAGQLNAAVVSRYAPLHPEDEEKLGEVDSYLVGKAGLPILSKGTVRLQELHGVPLVLSSSNVGLRSVVEEQARLAGIRLNIVVEVDSLESVRSLCLDGSAYSILQYGSVRREVANGTLQAARIIEPSIARTIALCVSNHTPISRATRLVLERLRVLVPELLAHFVRR